MRMRGEAEMAAGPGLSISDGSELSPVCCLVDSKVSNFSWHLEISTRALMQILCLQEAQSLKWSRACQYPALGLGSSPSLLFFKIEVFKTYGFQMWRRLYKVICQTPPWFLNAGDVMFELFWIQGFLRKGKTSQPQGWCNRWGGRLLGREWDGEKRNRLGQEEGIRINVRSGAAELATPGPSLPDSPVLQVSQTCGQVQGQ